MMSKRDFELVAQVIHGLTLDQSVLRHVSVGNRRRAIAVAFADAMEEAYPSFDRERFEDRAIHNI